MGHGRSVFPYPNGVAANGIPHLGLKSQGRAYADFSVSQSNLEWVKQYIANQADHHRKISFQDELRALLKKHEAEWDEKYVWD